MAGSSNEKLFRTKVLPIMDKVMADLRHKQLEEIGRHTSSLSFIMAGAAGPDGGMSAQAASLDSLRYTGEWNSKHTEDYINMVKAELKRQKITVTPEIEKMMIDKMIKDEVPKSSIDYIIRKAATNTIFYLPQALNKSPLENHISEQAEKRYNPNHVEKAAGLMLGATADYLSFGGIGGTLTGGAKFIGVDLALNAAMDKATENVDTSYRPSSPGAKPSKSTAKTGAATGDDDVPMIIAPEYREQYKAEQAKRKAEEAQKREAKATPKVTTQQTKEDEGRQEPQNEAASQTPDAQPTQATMPEQPLQTNPSGWNGLLSSFGLNGISDIGNNLGYVLAMLPDMLVGAFTGKTKSLGLKENLMPLASIVAGMFVRNPILKMVLVGMGGLNLLNKAGHEAIGNHAGQNQAQGASPIARSNYKVYADESLNQRISQPQIRGNCLIATIDKVPCTIALPDKVVDAYNQGALPLNTLANAVLAKNDQMRQLASENYEAQQRTETRTLAQR